MKEAVSANLKNIALLALGCFLMLTILVSYIKLWYEDAAFIFHGIRDNHVIINIMETIPVVDISSKDFKDGGVECAICLGELANGDKAKILPRCNHCFHIDCIDSWFRHHHITCPICRNKLGSIQQRGTMSELGNSSRNESLTQNPEIPSSSQHLGSPTDAC